MAGRAWRACFGLGALLVVLGSVGVSAALAATASLEFNPPTYNFGPVPYGSGPTEPHEVTLTNTGDTQLVTEHWRSQWVANWPEASDPFWVTSSNCHTLEPGESCSIGVVFDPAHPGTWTGWQTVRSQIEEEPWTELELSGEGTGPWVPVTPDHVDFESVAVGMTTTPQTITVESQDGASFKIEDISFIPVGGASSTPFQVVGGSCHEGESLAPGKTCTIEVAMAPAISGPFQSKLEIADTAPGSPQSIELEGSATVATGGQPINSLPTAIVPHAGVKHACPKGKRKVVKKGRRICVNRRRHRRRYPHPAN